MFIQANPGFQSEKQIAGTIKSTPTIPKHYLTKPCKKKTAGLGEAGCSLGQELNSLIKPLHHKS